MDKIKVLFIDDDIDFGKMLSLALEENGIKVYYSNSLAGIVAAIKEISPNIILLDVEIGTQSGIDTLPQIKAVALHTPILFVSSHHESEVAIQAIQKGGLNYLRKPFEIDELLAYIYRYVNVQCNNELLFEQFTLDIEKRLLKRNGEIIAELTPFENNILTLLATSPNEIVPREKIIHSLWEDSSKINELSLNNYIVKLRKIFQPYPSIQILTYRNQVFKLQID